MAKLSAKLGLSKKSASSVERLRWFNFMLAGLFALQAVAIWFLSEADKSIIPVTANFLTEDKLASDAIGTQVLVQGSTQLFDIKTVYLVVAFLLAAAVGHLLASTLLKKRYQNEVGNRTNTLRWAQYSLSFGLAVVTVGLLIGVEDIASILALFGLVVLANIARMFSEKANAQGNSNPMRDFWISIKAGFIALTMLAIYVWAAEVYGSGLSTYLYFVLGMIFAAFILLSVVFRKAMQKKGRWSDYGYVDWLYMVVSLVGLSAIAWQIFAGTLR